MNTLRIRKTVQLTALALFIFTVFQATYPYAPLLPPETFLWLDPLAGLTTMLASRAWIPWFLLSLAVLLSPLVAGRAFCGWICPLGTCIDGADHLLAPKKDRIGRRFSHWKLIILVFLLALAILGINFAWFLDPLPLLWRTFGAVIIPGLTLLVNTLFGALLDLHIAEDVLYRSYDFLTAAVIPLQPMLVHGALLVAVLTALLLGLSAFSRRFWCRSLCPLGALLGFLARFSPLQRVVDETRCNDCSLCRRKCKMGAINADFTSTEKAECILCLNCAEVCKPAGTSYTFQPPLKMTSPAGISRRAFLGITTSGLAAATVLQIGYQPRRVPADTIRPPGAVPEAVFLDRCLRCNECVRICASTGACLQPYYFESGLEGFLTPHADYLSGYCEYTCNLCGEICPTGAIQPLELEAKQRWIMGLAVFDQDLCIPYRLHENCLVCEEHCPTPAKAITFQRRPYADPQSGQAREVLYPVVKPELCIGCGICQEKCPLDGAPGVIVIREGLEANSG